MVKEVFKDAVGSSFRLSFAELVEKAIGSYDNILVLKIGDSQAPIISLEANQSFTQLLSLER